jgi:hypothetical protein
MLKLKKGYWTLKGEKCKDLNAIGQLVFNLLLLDKKNKSIVLCNQKKRVTSPNLKNQNYDFRRLH